MDLAHLLDVFLFVAWLFPLLVTIQYHRRVVSSRLEEIKGVFFSGDLDQKRWTETLKRPVRSHPAWKYSVRFGINSADTDLEGPLSSRSLSVGGDSVIVAAALPPALVGNKSSDCTADALMDCQVSPPRGGPAGRWGCPRIVSSWCGCLPTFGRA